MFGAVALCHTAANTFPGHDGRDLGLDEPVFRSFEVNPGPGRRRFSDRCQGPPRTKPDRTASDRRDERKKGSNVELGSSAALLTLASGPINKVA